MKASRSSKDQLESSSNVKNLKHAHNLTQTEVDCKIEVMLNVLENISITSLSPLYQLRTIYSKIVHTSFTIVVKWQMANAVKVSD